jgi:serine/threonine protein kinase
MATGTLAPGARVGNYEIVDRLGGGGMGVVYRARDTRLGRTVALKVLRPDADPELLRRLDREARAASALSHPNIVQIYDVGVAPDEAGEHYVVMEFVEGETLRRRLARGPLPIPEILSFGRQLADGLAKAHRAGVLHRDLKPENLVVTPDGRLKILDFGLAKLVPAPLDGADTRETALSHETRAGVLLGTLEYMSPEQASGHPVDARTDQFAVGLILAEMATGQPVFRRDTPAQVLAAVIEREPEPLRRLRPDAPEPLEAIVSRCLQKKPTLRFEKTDDLAAQLASLASPSRAATAAGPPPVPATVPTAISGEVVSASAGEPRPSALYHVQTGIGFGSDSGDGKIRVLDEDELVKRIRSGKLTGVELVRRDDEERWQPLFESRVFRREVPNAGDPREAARWRALRAVGGSFGAFAIVSTAMYVTQGHFPFWLGIWGAILAVQSLRAAPTLISILRRPRPALPSPVETPALPPPAPHELAPMEGAVAPPSAIAQEAARVRALIAQRGGTDVSALLAEVDQIVTLTAELAARQADLEEQTSDAERAAVARAAEEAARNLDRASGVEDRRLFERQLAVVRRREEAIAKAVRVRERLRVRQEMAEHQLKQLRLDLSRDAAVGLAVPELSSRLESIRHEVDAREEVAALDAAAE